MGAAAPIMAVAVPLVMGGVQAYTTYKGYKDQKKAAKESERSYERDVEYQRMETEEQVRRTELEHQQQEAKARALAAASGTKVQGTVSMFLKEMEEENLREIDWIAKSGASRADIIRERGRMARKEGKARAQSTLYEGIAGGISSVGKATSWW